MKIDTKQITETNKFVSKKEIKKNKERILTVFSNYRLQVNSISVITGSAISFYEVNLKPGIRVTKIKNLQDDITLSLARGTRIIIPRPYKDSIGIELPNKSPNKVSLKSIIASKEFQETKMELPLAIGETIPNKSFIIDLVKAPHILVGGSGQEISDIINVILASLLNKQHPSQIKFVLFDSKKTQLSTYSKIEKHYLAKNNNYGNAIITDIKKGEDTLKSLILEMEKRFILLNKVKASNIKEYNDKLLTQKANANSENKALPYLVVVINDYTDLVMLADKSRIEMYIARIAQQASVVGIHLIIATQQISTNIITGVIKVNIPTRISFKTESLIESRTIIDASGAQELIGQGDMLINEGDYITRVQSAQINFNEKEEILVQ